MEGPESTEHPPSYSRWVSQLDTGADNSTIRNISSHLSLNTKRQGPGSLSLTAHNTCLSVCLSMVGLWRCHKYLQYICIYILKTHRNVDICLEIGDFVVWKSVVLLHLDIQGWWLRGGAVKWKLFILILSWEPKVRNCITGPLRMFISHHPPHDNLGFDRNALVMSRHFARDMIRYNSFHFREIIRNYKGTIVWIQLEVNKGKFALLCFAFLSL